MRRTKLLDARGLRVSICFAVHLSEKYNKRSQGGRLFLVLVAREVMCLDADVNEVGDMSWISPRAHVLGVC